MTPIVADEVFSFIGRLLDQIRATVKSKHNKHRKGNKKAKSPVTADSSARYAEQSLYYAISLLNRASSFAKDNESQFLVRQLQFYFGLFKEIIVHNELRKEEETSHKSLAILLAGVNKIAKRIGTADVYLLFKLFRTEKFKPC